MDPRTQERVEEWDSRPFNGGFDGLSDLAAADFSGAVSAVGTWVFMLNGRIIGIIDGDIEDFETASGTQYEAPHPSLPLLCAMEERGGDTRAKYYTNETPLREVDNTLQSGSFTGYVELSENVLSGDYYAVYYGGRRMAAAYIGNAERLLTGDEAFDRAADEVGIYEVTDVDIEVTDVPGTGDASAGSGPTDGTTDGSDSSPATGAVPGTDPAASAAGTDTPSGDGAESEPGVGATGSAIDPIDISSTESTDTVGATGSDQIGDEAADDPSSLTGEIDLTGDASGITATDDAATESDSASSGITETDPSSSGSAPETDPSAGTDAASETGPTTDSGQSQGSVPSDGSVDRREQGATERVQRDARATADGTTAPATDAAPEPATDDRGTTDSPASEPGTTDTASSAADDGGADVSIDVTPADEAEPGTDTDGEAASDSSPDLAEVEAAAEELERNDISWVDEEGDNGPADGPTPEESTADSGDTPEDDEDGYLDEQLEREEAWRETRRIPSIDPDDSDPADETGSSSDSRRTRTGRSSASAAGADATNAAISDGSRSSSRNGDRTAESTTAETRAERSQTGGRQRTAATQSESAADGRAADRKQQRIDALTEKLETLQEQRDTLATKAEELEAERDRLQSTNDDLSATVERLQSRIEDLETELERERERTADADAADSGGAAETQLSAQQALSGTNLFVRYASKSRPTLETAHDGDADRSEVASNLRLEHHTQFDSAAAAVDGEPYADFLPSSMEFRFVDWLTEVVLYEIRDTGNADSLIDLYDAIPRIDRAELDATISLENDDTEDVPDELTFDIVAFDKMGNPLVLVTLNDSREPATKGMLEGLEEAASAIKANYPDLAAAFAVTSSYFEPGALEVAEEATSGGFLSRGSKLSYVNLSRKDGYHLCLVESRSEGFHMNVPEL
ncbi:DUF7527 domain-containing protein [Natrinema altunense]|uniref:Transcription factor bZIP 1 n=1 Tax=Natrinema altunense (strain JCM 12890 / CGMCC 1.3731 / AJ2) TaxID=1227494 RepID=L9ZWW5_NATA2|nr:hypothetical protein [Natrinema altunense]ELY89658.1 transcription factor bZIP 1 [Natrinema altunense JCM 12890]